MITVNDNMSLSKTERQANVDLALDLFLTELETEWIRTFTIDPENTTYSGIFSTTWGELTERYQYLQRTQGVYNLYTLTPGGWFTAMKQSGYLDGSEFKGLVGKLSASLKARVKGRREPALVEISTVADEINIARGIIANIIDVRYIDNDLKRYGCSWASGFEGRLIVVPTHFGLEEL